jgi:hypothetical protein
MKKKQEAIFLDVYSHDGKMTYSPTHKEKKIVDDKEVEVDVPNERVYTRAMNRKAKRANAKFNRSAK